MAKFFFSESLPVFHTGRTNGQLHWQSQIRLLTYRAGALFVAGLGSDDEVQLVNSLFNSDGYNPLIRPVRNLSQTVAVKFGLAMIQLINVVSSSAVHSKQRWSLL